MQPWQRGPPAASHQAYPGQVQPAWSGPGQTQGSIPGLGANQGRQIAPWAAPQQGIPGPQRPQFPAGAPPGLGQQSYLGQPSQSLFPQIGQQLHANPAAHSAQQGYHLPPAPARIGQGSTPAQQQFVRPNGQAHSQSIAQAQQGRPVPGQPAISPAAQASATSPASVGPTGLMRPAWTEHTAPDGRKYFYNSVTKVSSWTRPVDLPAQAPLDQQSKSESLQTPKQEQLLQKSEVQCDWKEFTAPDGRKYYYNRSTKESRWQMPDELKQAQALAAASKVKASPAEIQVLKLTPEARPTTSAANGLLPTKSEAKLNGATAMDPAYVLPEPQKPVEYATKEEAKDAFKELLASVGTASNASWDSSLRLIVNDPRYQAFKTIGEKKACFNEYLQQRAKEEKEESRAKAKQARDDFFNLLELSPELRTGMRYSKALNLFDDEPRWKAITDTREREQLFNEHMKERERKEKEQRRAMLRKRKASFRDLLDSNKSIKVDSEWRKIQGRLEGEDEYEALDKFDRLEVFQDHIKDLEKREKERKETEKTSRKRQERKHRDMFKDLLKRHLEEEIIVPKMKWKEYVSIIAEENVLKAVEKNSSGSRPKELFEDVLEGVEDHYLKVRTDIREAKSINVEAGTSYDDFLVGTKDVEAVQAVPTSFKKAFFEEELGKVKEKAAKEERRRRYAREDFRGLLKDQRHLKHDTAWEDAKQLLEKEPEYNALDPESREEIFVLHIQKLLERREKEREIEKEKEERKANKAEEDKPRKDKKRHKKDKNGDKKSKDKDKGSAKRKNIDLEPDEEKKGKRHKKAADNDATLPLEGSLNIEDEPTQDVDNFPTPGKPGRKRRDESDAEDGQL